MEIYVCRKFGGMFVGKVCRGSRIGYIRCSVNKDFSLFLGVFWSWGEGRVLGYCIFLISYLMGVFVWEEA